MKKIPMLLPLLALGVGTAGGCIIKEKPANSSPTSSPSPAQTSTAPAPAAPAPAPAGDSAQPAPAEKKKIPRLQSSEGLDDTPTDAGTTATDAGTSPVRLPKSGTGAPGGARPAPQ